MAASSSSLPFSPFILGLFLSISVFISLITPSHSALTCDSLKLSSNRTYANCTDLPALGATLHFTYNTTNRSLAVAFAAAPPSPDGWVAWGLNTAGGGMVGAQALIAYKLNGKVEVHPYNLTSYKGIDPVKSLSVETWDLAAEESDGGITLFAVVELPEKADNISQVWQVGPVVSGKPAAHQFKPENLKAKEALPVVGTTAVETGNSSTSGSAGGEKSGETALVMVLLFVSFITM